MQPQLCASRKVNRFANVSHTALWGYGLALQQGVPKLSTENINWSIKLGAQTITKTNLRDKVSSKSILKKASLRTLNKMFASQTVVMVWKSNKAIARNFFPNRSIIRTTRPINSLKATQPGTGKSFSKVCNICRTCCVPKLF